MKKITAAFAVFVICFMSAFGDDAEDELFGSLAETLGIEQEEEQAQDEKIVIDDIDITINGTTKLEWVQSKLIIKKEKEYSEKELTRLLTYQKQYFNTTNLFYSSEVYLLPSEQAAHYVLHVNLVDGFMQIYNFSPWDLQWGIRHLLGREELLTVTLGYNTQGIEWNRPAVRGTPFSYYLYADHFYGDYDNNSKINSGTFKSKLFATLGVWTQAGAVGEYTLYHSDFEKAGSGHYIKWGGFVNVFPSFEMFTPFGFNLYSEGGYFSEPGKTAASPYFNVHAKALFHPVKIFSAELSGKLYYTGKEAGYVCMPSPFEFRSSETLERKNIFTRMYLQLNLERIFTQHIRFTSMTLNPYVFGEAAATMSSFEKFNAGELHYSAGSALAIGFDMPVNLLFSFGVKCGIAPTPGAKFLFSVDMKLY
ncbi:MAG: hypothetical protein ACTTKL_05515 [Treponema sp.]